MAAKYDPHFNRLEEKLDKLDSKLDEIVVVQTKQQVILEDHIARTYQVEEALKPLKAQQNQLLGAVKLISFLGILASIAAAVYKIFN